MSIKKGKLINSNKTSKNPPQCIKSKLMCIKSMQNVLMQSFPNCALQSTWCSPKQFQVLCEV